MLKIEKKHWCYGLTTEGKKELLDLGISLKLYVLSDCQATYFFPNLTPDFLSFCTRLHPKDVEDRFGQLWSKLWPTSDSVKKYLFICKNSWHFLIFTLLPGFSLKMCEDLGDEKCSDAYAERSRRWRLSSTIHRLNSTQNQRIKLWVGKWRNIDLLFSYAFMNKIKKIGR